VLPQFKAEITPFRLKLRNGDEIVGDYQLPTSAYDFVRKYDYFREVKPFEFEFPYQDDKL
jgi:hypothetical protein